MIDPWSISEEARHQFFTEYAVKPITAGLIVALLLWLALGT